MAPITLVLCGRPLRLFSCIPGPSCIRARSCVLLHRHSHFNTSSENRTDNIPWQREAAFLAPAGNYAGPPTSETMAIWRPRKVDSAKLISRS